MTRPLHRLQFLADASATSTAVADAAATYMHSRTHYRGGRSQPRRSFTTGGGGHSAPGGGDSHFRPVREPNLGFRHGESGSSDFQRPSASAPPHFNRNRQFRHPPPPHFYQNQQFRPPSQPPRFGYPSQNYRRPPPLEHNQAPRPAPQFRPRPPDYRTWELAKTAPSSASERFTVLSYNILADYLALDHRATLYYHIPRHMLDWQWRKRSLLFELGLWYTDIICFQEVDRFQDLEEELKRQGYNGIWKMRTGKAVDGCAVFWRVSRFKLLYEESIEFNKFGLRDNVAQICVFESVSQNCGESAASPLKGSTGSSKVVICNIHVLYNPKRGEIKLAQVRILLNRAHAVSKKWNDAPIVLCGDFNCVPKSPLYNYISEQKLELSGLGRDKVSGQASAEIRVQRTYNTSPNFRSGANVVSGPSMVQHMEDGIKQNESYLDTQKSYNSDRNLANIPLVENFSELKSTNALNGYDRSSTEPKHDEDEGKPDGVEEETQQKSAHNPSDSTKSTCSVLGAGFKEDISLSHGNGGSSASHFSEEVPRISSPVISQPEEVYSDATEIGHRENVDSLNLGSFSGNSGTSSRVDEESMNPDNLFPSSPGHSSQKISTDNQGGFSSPSQSHFPSASTSMEVQEKIDSLFVTELDRAATEGEAEDNSTFLSELRGAEDSFPLESDHSMGLASASHDSSQGSPNNGVDDFSQDLDQEPFDMEQSFYDPSSWTPGEIETATGNADCTSLEHPLKLTSTYTDAEDTWGIRDSNGEPLVTSYHKRFMGTVDYIWRSEGLNTVRVLAPIPKHVMQTTSGFPTRKWGSDHIALAAELAFAKDEMNHSTEVQQR